VSGATGLSVTPAELVSIDVTPTNASVPLGSTRQLTATGTYTDATTQDLTSSVAWVSSDELDQVNAALALLLECFEREDS